MSGKGWDKDDNISIGEENYNGGRENGRKLEELQQLERRDIGLSERPCRCLLLILTRGRGRRWWGGSRSLGKGKSLDPGTVHHSPPQVTAHYTHLTQRYPVSRPLVPTLHQTHVR